MALQKVKGSCTVNMNDLILIAAHSILEQARSKEALNWTFDNKNIDYNGQEITALDMSIDSTEWLHATLEKSGLKAVPIDAEINSQPQDIIIHNEIIVPESKKQDMKIVRDSTGRITNIELVDK